VEELSTFMDEFNHQIFDMVSSSDVSERKGAILAIGLLKSVLITYTSCKILKMMS